MAGGETFLEFEKFLLIFFTLACVSRYPIAPIVKIYETIVSSKYKAILEGYILLFTGEKIAPG